MRAFDPGRLPAGYTRIELPGLEAAVLEEHAEDIAIALSEGKTLYRYAYRHPQARELQGRGVAYSIPLPKSQRRVVVRHSRHGGALAGITGDRFFAPTRAPHELLSAHRMREQGIATPALVAAVTYNAGPGLRRSDIATAEVTGGRDLSLMLAYPPDSAVRREALRATGRLLGDLARAGIRHHDLNLKNVLCVSEGDGLRAYVLDVDRVRFKRGNDAAVLRANLRRLARSARKWHVLHGLAITGADLTEILQAAGDTPDRYTS